jgi:iron complex outermembrane receptor protein
MDGYVRGLLTYYPKNDRANGEGSGFTADAYGLLNLYIGARHADGRWDIQLFARNLTNSRKTLTYSPTMEVSSVSPINLNFGQSGYYRTTVTPLREFGITARYSFGSR